MTRKRPGHNPHQLLIDWEATSNAAEPEPKVQGGAQVPVPVDVSSLSSPATRKRRTPSGRVIARLPVPRPLPASVAAGRFGRDEDGQFIRPAPDEVRAITENQADKLIDMLDAIAEAGDIKKAHAHVQQNFDAILAAYAQDFGDHAARQLEAFVRRQTSLDESSRTDQGWHR